MPPAWLVAVLLVALATIGQPVWGAVEGRLMPVTSDPVLHRIEDAPGGGVTVWGSMAKIRDCRLRHFDWRMPGREPSAVGFRTGSAARRDVSAFGFGPWHFDVPRGELGRIEGVLEHQCHWHIGPLVIPRPWLTVTIIRPVLPGESPPVAQ